MQIVREIENYIPDNKPLYLALGNFDGLHQGHQNLIKKMVKMAYNNGTAAAFVFEPHPIKVLFPERAPKLLVTPERKAKLFEKFGVNLLIYNSFNESIAKCPPAEFIKTLCWKLRVKHIFVGFNYTFGHKAAGTPELLQELGEEYGFQVSIIPQVKVCGVPVSSSLIRQALSDGNIKLARAMLGYNPILDGQVVEGEQRGRTIGFPTANISISGEMLVPGKGVYAAKCKVREKVYNAVVNIGSKPTFHEEYRTVIEAHLIDFESDIYGENISLYFLEKIRDERKFSGTDELVKQIIKDKGKAQEIVVNH
ncbi:MAG: bifunctional riboflavin kinase/FAD synthetase [Syntrophomonadaceae bacterium]|jgi:riboflavin kinase/FMN adenylyltransferase